MKSNNQLPWCLHCFLVLIVIYHCFSLAHVIYPPKKKQIALKIAASEEERIVFIQPPVFRGDLLFSWRVVPPIQHARCLNLFQRLYTCLRDVPVFKFRFLRTSFSSPSRTFLFFLLPQFGTKPVNMFQLWWCFVCFSKKRKTAATTTSLQAGWNHHNQRPSHVPTKASTTWEREYSWIATMDGSGWVWQPRGHQGLVITGREKTTTIPGKGWLFCGGVPAHFTPLVN